MAKNTNNWQAIIHCIIWFGLSDLGDFEIIIAEIVISVKNSVVSKAILPGIASGGITKPI